MLRIGKRMYNLIISNFNEKIENLDELFRMFEPKSIQLFQNKKATVTFKTREEAQTCIDIVSLKPELVRRRIGNASIRLDNGLSGGGTPKTKFNYKPCCFESGTCDHEVKASLLKFPKKI